jgi:hypothetical protein
MLNLESPVFSRSSKLIVNVAGALASAPPPLARRRSCVRGRGRASVARHEHDVPRVGSNAARFREHFEQRRRTYGFKHHRVIHGPDHRDGLAMLLLYLDSDLRIAHQAVHLQQFRQLVLQLECGQPLRADLRRNQRQCDEARLIHANLARELRHFEYFDVEQVAVPDHVIPGTHRGGLRKLQNPGIGIVRRFKFGSARR